MLGDVLVGWTGKDGSGPGRADECVLGLAGCWCSVDCATSSDSFSSARLLEIPASSLQSLSSFSAIT